MREIKFRVWNKIKCKMRDYGSDEACNLWENGCDFWGMSFISCQSYVIWMQYTGLKDKNDVEIYEGDIVRTYDENDNIYIGEVFYNDPHCKYLIDNKSNRTAIGLGKYSSFDIEVIGNIYENLELIKEK